MSDALPRHFAGREVLQKLLTKSGTLADVDDIAGAFKQAVADNVPVSVVIQALWEDEPRFAKPAEAKELFSNLLGLYDLIAEGGTLDLAAARKPRLKLTKAALPSPWKDEPDEPWIEAAWKYFEDHPKERQKLQHTFENKQDALVSWLDAEGLSDEGFGTAQALCSDVFALLKLGGVDVIVFDERVKQKDPKAPAAIMTWVDDALFEASNDEEAPLKEAEVTTVRALVLQVVSQWWKAHGKG